MNWKNLKKRGSDHYKASPDEVEPIDLFKSGNMLRDFALASIIKYAYRNRLSIGNPVNKLDMEKIRHYADMVEAEAKDLQVAGILILDEDENQELEKEDFAVEELIISRLHSKSISKSQCEVLFEMFPNLKIVEKYRIELFQHVKE